MVNTLNSIYLRLDVGMQNLASKALAQIIVKIVYSSEGSITKKEIKEELSKVNGGRSFNEVEIDDILAELANKELSCHKGSYYLSQSKRNKIAQSISESDQRREQIIDKYFSGLNTDKADIEAWFAEMSIKFFETFSDEWISDLLAKTNHIVSSADSIREQVTRRTQSMKNIDLDDKTILPDRFFAFVNSHEDIVDSYLWEYGTSAFASKLIRNKHGVDKLTIDTFKNSFCVFDTNVLLFIALENKYQGSFKAIEKVFEDLNVKAGILYITKREYENKVRTQKGETLSNLEKYGYEITAIPDDDFTKIAIKYGCKEKTDFERFFDTTLSLPSTINSRIKIILKDNDNLLAEAIDTAQADQTLLDKFNGISKKITRKPKRDSACRHDVGLIEGVRYLRGTDDPEDNKCFILTDDSSINHYSKEYGLKNGLPLALRVDTLINMLAINNGGDTFDAADYRPLFANIIRLGLIPRKDTFRQAELYRLSQMNGRVTQLPTEQVRTIALEMHRRILEGRSEEEIRRDLNEMVTKGEIAAKDEVGKAAEKLDFERKQREHFQAMSERDRNNLLNTIKQQVEKEYDSNTCLIKVVFGVILTIVAVVLLFLISYLYMENTSNGTRLESLILGLLGGAIVEIVGGILGGAKLIRVRAKKRIRSIDAETHERLKKLDEN